MRIKLFRLFNRVESPLRVFENRDSVLDIVTVIKDMLLELDFLDIENRVDIVRNHSKLQVDESPEIIVINLWKKAIKIDTGFGFKPSYTWSDISHTIGPVIEYLEVEGFEWLKDRGTLAYSGVPIVSTSGSVEFDTIKSKVEMWFIR